MAQLCSHKLFTSLTRNTAALRAVTISLKRPYAKSASPDDYGYCKFLLLNSAILRI